MTKHRHGTLLLMVVGASALTVFGCQVSPDAAVRLRDGAFQEWSHGSDGPPDGWSVGGGKGMVHASSGANGAGGFVTRLAPAGGDLALYQDVSHPHRLEGHRFDFSAWVKASSATAAQLTVNAGNHLTQSQWHSGGGGWELLVTTGSLPDETEPLRFHVWARNGALVEVGECSLHLDIDSAIALDNPDFAAWTTVSAPVPERWVFGGAGQGAVIRRSPQPAPGSVSGVVIEGVSGDVVLYQDVTNVRHLRGEHFRFAAWVKTSRADAAQLAVGVGTHWYPSAWHSGHGGWELLTIDGQVPDDAELLRFHLWARNGSAVEFGGVSVSSRPSPTWRGLRLLLALSVAFCAGLVLWAIKSGRLGSGHSLVERLRTWLAPERFLLVAGAFFGGLFLVLTPPLQAPDEPVHFMRAFAIAEGHVLADARLVDGKTLAGAEIPRSLIRMQDDLRWRELPFHAERKFDPALADAILDARLYPQDRSFVELYTMAYAPVPYLPQALAIAVGKVCGLSPLALLYLVRFANLICFLAGMWWAVRLTPVFKWGFALLALMPMSLFVAASASPDVSTIWLSFVVIASFLEAALRHEVAPPRGGELARLVLLCVLLSLCKQIYFVLSLLFLLLPVAKLGSRSRYLGVGGLVLILQALANLAWWHLGIGAHAPIRGGSSPQAQLAFILADPVRFVGIFIHTVRIYGNLDLTSFVGNLGWLDVMLPSWLIVAYLFVLVIVASGFTLQTGVMTLRNRMVLAMTFGLVFAALEVWFYLTWSKVGAPAIEGAVGRYFIPAAPVAFLAIAGGWAKQGAESIKLRLAGFVILALAIAVICTAKRYYSI